MLQNMDRKWMVEELNIIEINGEYEIGMTKFDSKVFSMFEEKKYKNILDLGCGKGKNSLLLAKRNFIVYATDASLEVLEKLSDKIDSERVENISIYNYSFTRMGFSNNFFDAVLCKSTLHHATFDKIKVGINEVFRVLKPGGCFVFDMISKEDESYGKGKLIEKDTFIGSREGEEEVPHYYTDINELKDLLSSFENINISKKLYIISGKNGQKFKSKMYNIIAFK